MTISSITRRAGPFAGNGVTTAFPFTFKVFAKTDVSVQVVDALGDLTTLTLDSDYSVTLNADQNANPGGTITYPISGSPLPAGSALAAVGSLLELQPTDITNNGGFYPSVIEDALDRTVILVQQLSEQIGRQLTVPITDESPDVELPTAAQRANMLLAFDANGNPTILVPASGSAADVLVQLALGNGASRVGFTQLGTGAVTRTMLDEIRDRVSVFQFMTAAQTADVKARTATLDHTLAVYEAMVFAKGIGARLVFPPGKYVISDVALTFADQEALTLEADGSVELYSNKTAPRSTGGALDADASGQGTGYVSDYFIRTQPIVVGTTTLTANAERGNVWLSVGNTSLFQIGSLIRISSTRLIQTESRGGNIEGQIATVEEVDTANSRIRIRDPLAYTAAANTITNGTVASVVASDTLTLSGIALTDAQARVQCFFPTHGNAYSYISRWNASTNTAYFRGQFAYALPSGVAAGDAVQLQWATTITVYTRYSFQMLGDFTLQRPPTTNATAADLGYRGLDVYYAKSCVIRGLKAYHFSEAGVRLWNCYRPIVEDAYLYGSNRAYNVSDGTGYGISVWGSYAPVITNASGAACRRLVDIAGANAITWFGLVRGPQFDGGGIAYDGNEFWPTGPTWQSICGSHGGGYYTKFIDVSGRDCRQFIEIRGYSEKIINPEFSGYNWGCIYMYGGGTGLEVIGGSYRDVISDPQQNLNYQTSSMRGNTAKWFVYVDLQNDYPQLGLQIKDVRCISLSQSFVSVDTSGSVGAIAGGRLALTMADCVMNASAVGVTNTTFNMINLGPALGDVSLDYTDGGGNRIFDDGTFTGVVAKLQYGVVWNQTPGAVVRIDDMVWLGCVAASSVLRVKVPASAKMATLNIFDREQGQAYRGIGIVLSASGQLDYSPLQASNKTGIALYNVPLTGTTGASGSLNLAFRPSGTDPVTGSPATNFLYIENRLGGEMRPVFSLNLIE